MWQTARGFKAQSLLAAIYRKPGSLAIKLPGFPITEKSTAPQPRQPVAKVFKPIPNSFRPPPPGGAHEEPQLSATYIHNKKTGSKIYRTSPYLWRRPDSNWRPLGYEPNELPLLHSAICVCKGNAFSAFVNSKNQKSSIFDQYLTLFYTRGPTLTQNRPFSNPAEQ